MNSTIQAIDSQITYHYKIIHRLTREKEAALSAQFLEKQQKEYYKKTRKEKQVKLG